jgi:hypothetical protein
MKIEYKTRLELMNRCREPYEELVVILPDFINAIMALRRIAPKLHRQCENDCNGEGYIPKKGFFRCDNPSAYIGDDTVFTAETERLVKTAQAICTKRGWVCEFQGDPRGWELKITRKGIDLTPLVYNA